MPTSTAALPKKETIRLRIPQLRVLKVLAKGESWPRSVIAKKAKVAIGVVSQAIGPVNPNLLKSHNERYGYPSLLTLKMVRLVDIEESCFAITPLGKSAYEKQGSGVEIPPPRRNRFSK